MANDVKPQDVKAVAKPEQTFEDRVLAAVSAAIAQSIPLAMAAITQMQATANAAPGKKDMGPACNDCRQLLSACKGEHEELVVLPANQRYASFFEGLILNGVRYLSAHPGHKITVPKGADFKADLNRFAIAEETQTQGRVNVNNHLGYMTKNGFVGA